MKRLVGAGLVALAAIAGLYGYGSGGAYRFDSTRSPDGTEAVDFYAATRLQRWRHPGGDLVGYVGLRRLSDDATLATSEPFELTGEHLVMWDRDQVQVGSSAVYDRARHHWSLTN